MQVVSCHNGQLYTLAQAELNRAAGRTFCTGLAAVDDLLAGEAFACGAVHEVLAEPRHPLPCYFAFLLARGAAQSAGGAIVWCDRERRLYPPALSAGISLERLFVLHPREAEDECWAMAECLGCKGVAAAIWSPPRLSRLETRRLQLSAERGGAAGILLRRTTDAIHYAAATRWLVVPAAGGRVVQRWTIQLIHAHGGHCGQKIILERCRETNLVRAIDGLADRPAPAAKFARA